ncbi:glycerophosphocholine phosphodiesterase GPCPD1-like [Eupeodes corollae]|uniref:glycerophosphocholine phosphodiesterase GPCPD1-like n=1 Tax=Eupeodes corollae TaxID=290404 RepID=UPI002490150F|nr:glycerophosphocholine phosphodiesterase GPCPD1-like [Eupeodes corollae]
MTTNGILFIFAVTVLFVSSNGFPSESDYSNNQNSRWRPNPKSLWNFNVVVDDQHLEPNEGVYISGDAESLGAWSPNGALALSKTDSNSNKWSGCAKFPANSVINYRYFIGVVDSMGDVQIRDWETNVDGRTLNLGAKNAAGTTDRFGVIKDRKEVSRGWLNNGYILQFKLFRNPITLENFDESSRIYVKVTPVNYDWSDEKKLLEPIQISSRANVEYIRMEYGNSKIRDQPKRGVPYDRDDIVLFHITTNDLKNVAYKFTLYEQDDRDPEIMQIVGYQYLYPETIDGSEGSTELDLMSKDEISSVGLIKVGYLLVKPISSNKVNLRTTFAHYWRDEWTALDAGHRGLGNSLELIENAAPVIENTVESMKQSVIENADMVEFDVQLTKDLIPIIYHDYVILVSKTGQKPKSKADLKELLIKDLTYEELKNLVTYQVVGSKIIEYRSHNMESRKDYRLFPLFEQFLTEVDHDISFDIEIKWPQMLYSGEMESTQTIDKNLYVDRILDVMLHQGCGRLSFFSSLDADICTLLQFKQNMYPVMFLGPAKPKFYEDPRSDNLEETINNAQAMGMLGIVPHTSNFLTDGSRLDLATDLGLKTFIWGDDSNSTERVDYFKSLGATGVIYDRIDKLIRKEKRSVFAEEQDLPEYFDKQCS